jgi:hypothetical protein
MHDGAKDDHGLLSNSEDLAVSTAGSERECPEQLRTRTGRAIQNSPATKQKEERQ